MSDLHTSNKVKFFQNILLLMKIFSNIIEIKILQKVRPIFGVLVV